MLSSNIAEKNKQNQKISKHSEVAMVKFETDSSAETKNIKRISYDFKNLKDFPKLGVSGICWENKFSDDNTKRSKSQVQKSWLSIANANGNNSKFKENFMVSPDIKDSVKNKKHSGGAKNNIVEKCLPKEFSGLSNCERKGVGNLGEASSDTTKKCSTNLQKNTNKKKRSDPILINLNEILKANRALKKSRQDKVLKSKFHRHKNKELISGNLLDSSNPKRSRGKHREVIRKRLTNLKLTIIKERIMKQKMREKALAAYFEAESDDLIQHIDFKVEIEKYLVEVNKRKVKEQERKNNSLSADWEKVIAPAADKSKETCATTGESSKGKNVSKATVKKEFRFSAKLREYCGNSVTPNLNSAVTELIEELVSLQDKLFARDPIKAKARRRHVSGIKEVKKHLTLKKAKMVIIAPNLEKLEMEGSVFDLINELKSMAHSQNVPCVFALDRYKLGRCTKKNVPVSAFAVLNYEGIETSFENVLRHLKNAKDDFNERTQPKISEATEEMEKSDVTSQVISSFISAFQEGLQISEKSPNVDSKSPGHAEGDAPTFVPSALLI